METIRKLQAKILNLAGVVLSLITLTAGTAVAGDGWGDFTDANGNNSKVPTFYANSPSGMLTNAACFDANGAQAANCDTGTALRKFVAPLPPVTGPGGPLGNSSGKYIPLAVPTKWANSQGVVTGDDYYAIAVVEWKERFHSDLANETTIRGYVQIDPAATDSAAGISNGETPVPGSKAYPLVNLDGSAVKISRPDGHGGFVSVNAIAVDKPHYLGPMITANQHTPTRITFYNLLPVGRAVGTKRNGDIFLPVDETIPGAGFGPDGRIKYTQNRSLLHLHGGDNPWISDGTPHQWIAPAGEGDVNDQSGSSVAKELATKHAAWQTELNAAQAALALAPADAALLQNVANLVNTEPKLNNYLRGVSAINVPDMPNPGPGAMTYYYPNGETARLEWYHDHTYGLTRLNVYAGEASAYLLTDSAEQAAIAAGKLPLDQIPMVIQDKTFVPKNIDIQDSRWDTALWGAESDLWFPHVYELNQDPNSGDGTNGVGRWDWGPYFWPVFPAFYDRLPSGTHDLSTQTIAGAPADTGLTEVTTTPEAFVDTPVINGEAYPTLTVEPKAYRFRMLNAMNDRMVNLGLYVAADKKTTNLADPLDPTKQPEVCDGRATRTDGSPLLISDCTEVKMVNFDTSYPNLYYPALTASTAPFGVNGQFAFPTTGGPNDTGWGPSGAGGGFMAVQAGVPDPATMGPDIHMIGNEGGFLAMLHTIPSTIINYENNKRSITILNVLEKGLFLGPAMRADAVIDFSQYAGKTLILYNDAPAPLPAGDPRIDYYTGMGDYSAVGGIENVKPGYGPNDRTIMQIYVKGPNDGATVAAALDTNTLSTTVATLHGQTQPAPVVPQPRYAQAFTGVNAVVAGTTKETLARIYTGAIYLGKYNGLTFTTPEDIKYTAVPLSNGVVCNTPANCAANLHQGAATATAGTQITAYVESKAIQELFEPTYGRMNATLGVELPFTSSLTQTTIPLGYVDPATEKVADGETQIWKITHNGIDAHPVHFHLVNVQVINRVGWDGTLKSPTDAEIGWKETVVMNPLEDVIVAVRAKAPKLPFGLPNSVRSRDPSQANGPLVQGGFTQVDPVTGNPAVVFNKEEDFGWEYVWHCHILGHEENDFMRAFVFDYWNGKDGKDVNNVAINRPDQVQGLAMVGNVLSWQDPTPSLDVSTMANPKNEIGFHIVRTNPDNTVTNFEAISNQTTFADTPLGAGNYTYTVAAWNQMGTGLASTPFITNINPVLPVAPSGLSVVSVTTNSVNLTWTDNATNENGYKVQSSTDGVNWITVNLPPQAGTGAMSYSVTGLLSNTTYQFQVAANNVAGDAFSTPVVSATTKALGATTVVVSSVTDTTATVTWVNANPGVSNAVLTVTDALNAVVQTINPATSGIVVSALTPNSAYTFGVVVTSSNGVAAAVATTTATTNAVPVGPITFANVGSTTADAIFATPASGGTPVLTVTVAGNPVVVGVTYNATGASVTGLIPNSLNTVSVVNKGTNNFVTSAVTAALTTNPAAIATPVATAVSDTAVNVTWTMPASGGTALLTVTKVADGTTAGVVAYNATGAAVTGLTSNTNYNFSVVVKSAALTSTAVSTTAYTNAAAATALTLDALSISTASLHWTNPVGNGTAVLSVSPMSSGITVNTTGNSSTLGGLAGNTQYTVSVVVVGTNGVASPAVTQVITTNIQAIAVMNVSINGLNGTVTWTYPSGGGSSQVVLSVSPSTNVAVTPTGGNSATVANLTPNTAYTFNLNTTGVNGTTAVTTPQTVMTNAGPVTNIQVANVTATGANVSWTAPVGGGNAVLTVLDANAVAVPVTQTPVLNGVTVTGLAPHTQYTFSVVVTGISGVPSAPATASAGTPAKLLAATNVIANSISATKVQLTWTDNSLGETGYTVEMRRNNGAWAVVPAANIVGAMLTPNDVANVALSVELTTAAMNQARYQFRVTPVSDNPLVGLVSVVATVDYTRTPNATVVNAVGGAGSVVMTWVPSTNTQSITVQRRANGGGVWTTIATIPGNSAGHTDAGLLPGSRYQYRVTFRNPAGTRVNTTANIVVQ